MRREGSFRQTAKRLLDDAIHAGRFLAEHHDGALPAYERLLRQVQTQTDLLHLSGRHGDNRSLLNAGLLALSLHHADWLRPVETWFPSRQNAWPLFTSLANHLLALYPVPPFMTSVWFDLPHGQILPQHGWYKLLGQGRNIRTANLPLRCTRAMAHLFDQAPHHYTAIAALRWAQVRGLGGSEALARAVVGTRLGKALENEDFWESVLLFFINHPSLEPAQVGPIVDFLQHQKFECKEGVSSEGVFGKQPPPRPDYTMKGRTAASVLRQVEEWHKQLGQDTNQPSLSWRHSPFKDFRLVEGSEALGNLRVWTITELLTSRALFVEGRAMRHCVATYADRCARRQTSIWSIQVENQRGRHRVLTIEVDLLKRTICQARKKCNRLPQTARTGTHGAMGSAGRIEGCGIGTAVEEKVMMAWRAVEQRIGRAINLGARLASGSGTGSMERAGRSAMSSGAGLCRMLNCSVKQLEVALASCRNVLGDDVL